MNCTKRCRETGTASGGAKSMQIGDTLSSLFTECFGEPVRSIDLLRGDGSERKVFRIRGTEHSAVGVFGGNVAENKAFIGFTLAFRACGLPVPKLFAVAPDQCSYLEEDLGDTLLFDWQAHRREGAEGFPEDVHEMYVHVLHDLVRFQIDAADDIDYTLCYQTAEFGGEAIAFDCRYFREMFLDRFQPRYDPTAYERDCARLIETLLESERRFFLYRDFQSRNVMITPSGPRYIDYQSGRRGALAYDVASLLFDARALIPPAVRASLLEAYLEGVSARFPVDAGRFEEEFHAYAVARVMQALGAFGNLGYRKNRPGFRSAIPPALDNLAWLAENAPVMKHLPYLRALFVDIAGNLRSEDFSEPV
ncbi:MAG: phosphotransferase [Bacteroidota bacterium]|nr:phosphotransferase [Bacteroidota bacterium]